MSGARQTYADWLRTRDDDELRALLSARPELVSPVPADLGALAARATTVTAISHCLDRLDRFTLAVIETILLLPEPATYSGTSTMLGLDGDILQGAVSTLRALGLVWGDDCLHIAPGVRQALRHPAGLGPPALEVFQSYPEDRISALLSDIGASPAGGLDELAAQLADHAVLSGLVGQAGPQAAEALDRLAWGPPLGRVAEARRTVRLDMAASPIERLLALGLLAATDDHTVVLPRETGLFLRDGRLFRDLAASAPELGGPDRGSAVADRTAGGQAFLAVRAVEDLLERWGASPPGVLRTGGLSVRDLRSAAIALDVEEWTAALLIEVAYSAGLLTRGEDMDAEWLPAKAYDLWLLQDTERRWATLAAAWLETERVPGLAGERDDRGRRINVLATEASKPSAARVRTAALTALATAPAGTAPDAEAVRQHLAWHEPRRGHVMRDQLTGWTLREAEVLGFTGRGALATHARELLAGNTGPATESLAAVLPQLVDHVLIQADLTAVAPGPLISSLARELALCADIESTGTATVYRFTPSSVRRALDAGRTSADLIGTLRRHSPAELPQPLTYLIEDVARRHGNLRVGMASSYVRCEDPVTLDTIIADRRAELLRPQRLAPTVLASRATQGELLETLRAMGYTPVAESASGAVMITRPDSRRAGPAEPGRLRRSADLAASAEAPDRIAAAVRALRAGEEAAQVTPPAGSVPRSPAATMIETLRAASEQGTRVWIGYLNQQGQASSRIVEPARVDGGFLTAYDATRAAIHRFALHRITGVAEVSS